MFQSLEESQPSIPHMPLLRQETGYPSQHREEDFLYQLPGRRWERRPGLSQALSGGGTLTGSQWGRERNADIGMERKGVHRMFVVCKLLSQMGKEWW